MVVQPGLAAKRDNDGLVESYFLWGGISGQTAEPNVLCMGYLVG